MRRAASFFQMFDRGRAIAQIEVGGCACPGCRGQLTDAV